jgi:hypothetical protein
MIKGFADPETELIWWDGEAASCHRISRMLR